MTRMPIVLLCMGLLALPAAAQPKDAAQPATQPAVSPTAPPSPEAMRLLDRLEKAGERYKALQAGVEYTWEDRLTGDSEVRGGEVSYQREADARPAKFRVAFETLKQGEGKPAKDKVDYAFDGEVLTVAKHRIKQMTRYQVAAPGQKVEAMKLGRGPFPLPFGQKTQDMLDFFEVKARDVGAAPAADEPANTEYLLLVTKPERRKETNIDKAEMWIDKTTGLPVRIVSRENRNKKTVTVQFKDVKTDVALSDETFLLPKPPGWTLNVEKFEAGKSMAP